MSSVLERAFTAAAGGTDTSDEHGDLLDAAFDLFCRLGIQRTTMDDVAKQAGVSRITVYRRVTSKEALVEQVVLREFRRYFQQFLTDISEAHTVADRVVVGFVSSLRAIRDNPMTTLLLSPENQALVPSILGGTGRTLPMVADFVAGQLRHEQRAGHVAASVDVAVVAELMVRMSTSFLVTPSSVVDISDDGELSDLARRYLVPMLSATDQR